MRISYWVNRGTGLGLACGVLIGAAVAALASGPRDRAQPPSPDAPAPAEKLAADKEAARAGCVRLCQAVNSYVMSVGNPGGTDEEMLPRTPTDLVSPPWGGHSFLPNGAADLTDPWGQPYQFQRRTREDGITSYIRVQTTAPDGTPISQHGIGPERNPR